MLRTGTHLVLRVRAIGWAVAAAMVLSCVAAGVASGAALVRVSGTLSGARPPAPGAGVSLVQALNLGDGALSATGFVDGRGRFSLSVPPGPYALLGGTVFFRGGLPTVRLVGALRARPGKPRRVALSLHPVRTHPRLATPAASAGPALSRRVGVMDFTGGAPYQNRGLATMIVTDLVPLDDGPPCAFTVVEMQQRDAIIREIRLQQTQFFDPASVVRPGQLLQPTLVVRGSLAPHGGDDVSYSLRVVYARNGRTKGTVSGRTGRNGWLTASGGIARQLVKIICAPDDLHFRLVAYSRTETSSTAYGQRTVTDTLSGGPGPIVTIPDCSDPLNCGTDMVLDGTVTTTANGHVTGTPSSGCPGGAFTYPTTVLQNPVHLDLTYDPSWVGPAHSSEAMIPSVGDVTSDICGANDSGDPQTVPTAVSSDDLLSGNPVTLTFSGGGTTTSSFGDHNGLAITWSLSERATIQRVQADGSPL